MQWYRAEFLDLFHEDYGADREIVVEKKIAYFQAQSTEEARTKHGEIFERSFPAGEHHYRQGWARGKVEPTQVSPKIEKLFLDDEKMGIDPEPCLELLTKIEGFDSAELASKVGGEDKLREITVAFMFRILRMRHLLKHLPETNREEELAKLWGVWSEMTLLSDKTPYFLFTVQTHKPH